jgi:hypothetical protein
LTIAILDCSNRQSSGVFNGVVIRGHPHIRSRTGGNTWLAADR